MQITTSMITKIEINQIENLSSCLIMTKITVVNLI